MTLQGSLRDIPLSDLLDLVTRNDTPGLLRFNYNQQADYQATLIVREAQLYFAWICKSTPAGIKVCWNGEAAIVELLSLVEANFSYELLSKTQEFPAPNIFSSRREILLASIFNSRTEVTQTLSSAYSNSSPARKVSGASQRTTSNTMVALPPVIAQVQVNSTLPETPVSSPAKAAKPAAKRRGWLSSAIAYIKKL